MKSYSAKDPDTIEEIERSLDSLSKDADEIRELTTKLNTAIDRFKHKGGRVDLVVKDNSLNGEATIYIKNVSSEMKLDFGVEDNIAW